jgi:hypothetical protein
MPGPMSRRGAAGSGRVSVIADWPAPRKSACLCEPTRSCTDSLPDHERVRSRTASRKPRFSRVPTLNFATPRLIAAATEAGGNPVPPWMASVQSPT